MPNIRFRDTSYAGPLSYAIRAFSLRQTMMAMFLIWGLTMLAMFPTKNRVASSTGRFSNLRLIKLAMFPVKVSIYKTSSTTDRVLGRFHSITSLLVTDEAATISSTTDKVLGRFSSITLLMGPVWVSTISSATNTAWASTISAM
jgi:hypothetical protein